MERFQVEFWRFAFERLVTCEVEDAAILAAAVMFAFVAAGCDDHVQVTRDPDVSHSQGATWAWTPEPQLAASRTDNRACFRVTNGARTAAA